MGREAHFKHLSARVQHSLLSSFSAKPKRGACMLAPSTRDTLGALYDKGPCPPPQGPRDTSCRLHSFRFTPSMDTPPPPSDACRPHHRSTSAPQHAAPRSSALPASMLGGARQRRAGVGSGGAAGGRRQAQKAKKKKWPAQSTAIYCSQCGVHSRCSSQVPLALWQLQHLHTPGAPIQHCSERSDSVRHARHLQRSLPPPLAEECNIDLRSPHRWTSLSSTPDLEAASTRGHPPDAVAPTLMAP